jgi:hypothetical protein
MTRNTQTTTERITALIFDAIRMDSTTFETVDAECAGQLAEARAEVERLRPAAEAWEALWRKVSLVRPGWGECSDITGVVEDWVYESYGIEFSARAAKEAKP